MAREHAAPDDTRFDVVHAIRVKGFASTDTIAAMVGASRAPVDAVLVDVEAAGLADFREGRISGWRLTRAGIAAHAAALAQQAADTGTDGPLRLHHAFVPLNGRVKELCTAWQVRDGAINDHTDTAYDGAVMAAAAALHVDVDQMLADAEDSFVRTGWYRARLQSANERFTRGDGSALARPLSDSYHDIWMELHQDLILTLGLTRTAADV